MRHADQLLLGSPTERAHGWLELLRPDHRDSGRRVHVCRLLGVCFRRDGERPADPPERDRGRLLDVDFRCPDGQLQRLVQRARWPDLHGQRLHERRDDHGVCLPEQLRHWCTVHGLDREHQLLRHGRRHGFQRLPRSDLERGRADLGDSPALRGVDLGRVAVDDHGQRRHDHFLRTRERPGGPDLLRDGLHERGDDDRVRHAGRLHLWRPADGAGRWLQLLRDDHGGRLERLPRVDHCSQRPHHGHDPAQRADQRHPDVRCVCWVPDPHVRELLERAGGPDLHGDRVHERDDDHRVRRQLLVHERLDDHRPRVHPRFSRYQLLRHGHCERVDGLPRRNVGSRRPPGRHEPGEPADRPHRDALDDDHRRRHRDLHRLERHRTRQLHGDRVHQRSHDDWAA